MISRSHQAASKARSPRTASPTPLRVAATLARPKKEGALRILALTNLYPSPVDPGRAPFNRQQLRVLASRHAVSVIAPVSWTQELAARRRHAPVLPKDRRAQCDGIPVEHPRYLFPPRVLRGWYGHFFRGSVRRAFERAVREFRPDVVYAPWAYPDGWAAVDLGHRAGLPVVIKVHGSDVLTLDDYPGRRRGTTEALRRADGVIAVSRDLAGRVIRLGADPGRVEVIYDGIDRRLFHPGPAQAARLRLGLGAGEPLILYVGRLVPIKGLDVLVDACARLSREGSRFACCLIGEGPLRPALAQQIARQGLAGRVRLLGGLPHEQLPDWYRAADVFVLPSHSEGVPNVLMEAMACGTPFVASRVGGIPEIAHLGAGELVPAGDAPSLARALVHCLSGLRKHEADGTATPRSLEAAAAETAAHLDRAIRRRLRVAPLANSSPSEPRYPDPSRLGSCGTEGLP